MKDGLLSLLTGESTISTLIGARCYVANAPQKTATLPYVLITQMGAEYHTSLDGGSNSLVATDFEIDCKAARSVEADALATAVRVFIDDYTGAAGSETVRAVIMNSVSDEFEPPQDGSDIGIYVVTIDATFYYEPA